MPKVWHGSHSRQFKSDKEGGTEARGEEGFRKSKLGQRGAHRKSTHSHSMLLLDKNDKRGRGLKAHPASDHFP